MLDAILRYVSPQRAVRRQLARSQLASLQRARMYYEGATTGNRSNPWRVASTDANAEFRISAARLRDVARDMVRNNAYALRAKSVIQSNVVGAGIIPSIVSKSAPKRKKLEELMVEHFDTTAIDSAGKHDLYGLQTLAMGAIVESGEVLIRLRPRRVADGLPLPFQIQVMEPDFLDTLKDGPLPGGNYASQGIEYDLLGRAVAYHLFRDHPGSTSPSRNSARESTRVPAEFIAHVYRVDRPGQGRGVSWFAPVVLRLRDFHDFSDAQLIRQKIAACFAAFVYSDDGGATTISDDESAGGFPLEAMEPGIIERLRPGEKVEVASPPGVGDYDRYSSVTLHEIAAGLGVSYEALTGDLSGVNFSSGRMGWLEFQRQIVMWRSQMLIPQMLTPIGNWLLQSAGVMGSVRGAEPAMIKWTPPKREMISPRDELPYVVTAIRAGLMTRSDYLRQQGFDPEKVEQEYADENERIDELELIFDSDPRNRTSSGNAVADPNAEPAGGGFTEGDGLEETAPGDGEDEEKTTEEKPLQ